MAAELSPWMGPTTVRSTSGHSALGATTAALTSQRLRVAKPNRRPLASASPCSWRVRISWPPAKVAVAVLAPQCTVMSQT